MNLYIHVQKMSYICTCMCLYVYIHIYRGIYTYTDSYEFAEDFATDFYTKETHIQCKISYRHLKTCIHILHQRMDALLK